METPYPEEYIAIQIVFARRMAVLLNEPVTETLRTMTSLYKMLDASGDFDADEPVWRGLLACVDEHPDEAEQARAIHRYYLSRYAAIPKFGDERTGAASHLSGDLLSAPCVCTSRMRTRQSRGR